MIQTPHVIQNRPQIYTCNNDKSTVLLCISTMMLCCFIYIENNIRYIMKKKYLQPKHVFTISYKLEMNRNLKTMTINLKSITYF